MARHRLTSRYNPLPSARHRISTYSTPGRSLSASQFTFDTLIGEQRAHHQQHPQSFHFGPSGAVSSFSPAAHHIQQTRIFTEPAQLSVAIPRPIQPRPSARSTDSPNPPSTNGDVALSSIVRTTGPAPDYAIPQERRKKRGRPTKEEAEERDRLLAQEGKVYEPKKRPVSKKLRLSSGSEAVPVVESEHADRVSAAVAEASDLMQTQTPLRQGIETREDTSSGKRRLRSQESHSAIIEGAVRPPVSPGHMLAPKPDPDRPAESPSDRFVSRFGERPVERGSPTREP